MCPGSCRPCRGFHFDQAAEIALDFAFISLESCTGTGGIRLQPPTHCTASTISSSSGSCSFCCYPSLAHSPSPSLSLFLSPSLSVWFRKLSFCSSSPKRKSYFVHFTFQVVPFPRTPTLSLALILSPSPSGSLSLSACHLLVNSLVATFVRNLCFSYRSFLVSGHFSQVLRAYDLPPPRPHYLSLCLPLHRFVFTGIPVLSIRGNGLPLSCALCMCECVCVCAAAPPGGVYGIRFASIDEGTRICNSISVYVWLPFAGY